MPPKNPDRYKTYIIFLIAAWMGQRARPVTRAEMADQTGREEGREGALAEGSAAEILGNPHTGWNTGVKGRRGTPDFRTEPEAQPWASSQHPP